MALMTVYHGGYQAVENQRYELIKTQKILVLDFIVRL